MNTVWIVLPVLIALMFQLGIELDRQAFAGVARRPAAVVAGLLGQLALLPLIAFGVGLAFRLPPVYFLGLLLVACCPGGSSSNVFSMLAKGDVALSVTLTALSSLITLFTIPLVMGFAARFVAVHAGAAIELPVGKLLVQNIVLLFLPMLCGALFRHWRPRAARRVHELLGRVAFPALMLLAAVFFVQYASTILENLGVLGLAGLCAGKKWGVFAGTVIGSVARFLVHWVVGATIWAEYMPDEFFGMTMTSPWFYSLLYNGSYMLPSIILCLVVFAALYKPMKKYFTAEDLKLAQ